ncbi:MAG: hypothetical protein FWF56_03010 [Firmicutes bacterium]|nr:hypothetical protein [Bacillota bacterium]MCL1954031.1 hypothetical protein [Bacillota bacterium]
MAFSILAIMFPVLILGIFIKVVRCYRTCKKCGKSFWIRFSIFKSSIDLNYCAECQWKQKENAINNNSGNQ